MDTKEGGRDIQVDIVRSDPPKAELIRGWDPRFDRWIYNRHGHERLERLWVPLVLVRDRHFEPRPDWARGAVWTQRPQEPARLDHSHRHRVYDLSSPNGDETAVEVIGTLEVSVSWARRGIEPEEVRCLLDLGAELAYELWSVSLAQVLRTVAAQAQMLLGATSAAVHLSFDRDALLAGDPPHFEYVEACGDLSPGVPNRVPPRQDGQGMRTIRENRAIVSPESDEPGKSLECANPELWRLGVRTLASFPLRQLSTSDTDPIAGVLYLHFDHPRSIQALEHEWVDHYIWRAVDAVREATHQQILLGQVRQRDAVQQIMTDLVRNPEDADLLPNIAWTTKNLFTADLVAVVAYDDSLRMCASLPVVVGEWQELPFPEPPFPLGPVDRFLSLGANLYAKTREELNPLRASPENRTHGDFLDREGIDSASVVRLESGNEPVGVMFIGYRRTHPFDPEERGIVEVLANAAASAIRNRANLRRRQQDLVTMAHQLKAPINGAFPYLGRLKRKAPEQEPQIERIAAFLQDALLLTTGIVSAFGKEMGHPPALSPNRFDPAARLAALCERLVTAESREDLRLEYRWDPQPVTLMTDPGVFTNVFYCLVHNAMKYADRGSTAVLGSTLHEAPALLELYLETTGEPILVQERDSIFEKAVRGSAVRKGRHHSGVGLGLWIAKGLATLVGGGLCLAPGGEDPRVSRFVVGLPIDWTPPN